MYAKIEIPLFPHFQSLQYCLKVLILQTLKVHITMMVKSRIICIQTYLTYIFLLATPMISDHTM